MTLLAFDEVEEREGDDVTTMLTPGEGDGFTETRRACNLKLIKIRFELGTVTLSMY